VFKLAVDFRGSTGFIVFKKTSSLSYAKLGSITLISKEDKDKFERVNITRRVLYMRLQVYTVHVDLST